MREGLIQNPAYPTATPPPGAINPIIDYPRATGGTVVGGYVYRGKQIPALRGTHIFGDYLFSKIFALDDNGIKASNFQDITADLFPTAGGGFGLNGPASFGEDANGELYVASVNTGSVFKIVPTTPNIESTTIRKQPGGSTFISAIGVPFRAHSLQAANSLVEQFMTIGTPVIAAGNGFVQLEDATLAPDGYRFYRVVYP